MNIYPRFAPLSRECASRSRPAVLAGGQVVTIDNTTDYPLVRESWSAWPSAVRRIAPARDSGQPIDRGSRELDLETW